MVEFTDVQKAAVQHAGPTSSDLFTGAQIVAIFGTKAIGPDRNSGLDQQVLDEIANA